uniref:Uncharacterized protein n=1 Tax=Rhodosorus marinus TaxID=101924 RepID=A0A7S2ZER2_9RHOD|mmetsp:Transcript_17018/g.69249  ORF Transcript_17018/g.69249 Transcript_17018/m.69249 type:complete len:218 (+) Transcript_17018:152-805(+)
MDEPCLEEGGVGSVEGDECCLGEGEGNLDSPCSLVPLKRSFVEERSISRTPSARSARTYSLRSTSHVPDVEKVLDETSLLAEMSSISDASSSSRSRSFLTRPVKSMLRRFGGLEDVESELLTSFHSTMSIVRVQSLVKDILKRNGYKYTEGKEGDKLKCSLAVKSRLKKPVPVHIQFIFDIGQTEICIYSPKPNREEYVRDSFSNFAKTILCELGSS